MSKKEILYKKIKNRLNHRENLDASSISISVENNAVVILGGEVSSYAEKCIVDEIILNVKGVKGVAEELKVNISTSYAKLDSDILRDALAVLKANSFVPENKIKIVVEDSALILSGQVDEYYQKEHMTKIMQNIIEFINLAPTIRL